jgi:hypothetical protein
LAVKPAYGIALGAVEGCDESATGKTPDRSLGQLLKKPIRPSNSITIKFSSGVLSAINPVNTI